MLLRVLVLLIVTSAFSGAHLYAQAPAKKVRMGIQSTNIGFLPFHVAFHKGFNREQGIDLEMIFMSTEAVNAAFVRGDLDYSAAVNGIIQGIGHQRRGSAGRAAGDFFSFQVARLAMPFLTFTVNKELKPGESTTFNYTPLRRAFAQARLVEQLARK